MSTDLQASYHFGPFRLDPENRLLLRDAHPIPLTPKAFDVLLLLIEHSGRLVLKDDLMKAVWPDTFVTESNLTQTVFMLRKALGESAGDQRYITTVAGRGYRFTADVRKVVPNGHSTTTAPSPVGEREAPPAMEKLVLRRWPLILVAVVALIAVLGVCFLWFGSRSTASPPASKIMLAVLPFENLTGDAGQEYFSDGLTEEMITQLGRLDPQHLGVIARTSVMHYKNGRQPLDTIARELRVQYVLEGSVRRDSGKVRITTQLIRASDQSHIWAHEYDRDLKDLLLLQSEIAQEVAEGVQLTFADDSKRVIAARPSGFSPASYEAYDLYLKGRYFWNKRTTQGFQQALQCFEEAIAKDPKYARAYAGLADSYALTSAYHLAPPNEVMPKARTAALKALQLDDGLAEAHTSLALIAENYDWDWKTSEKEFRRAIQLNSNYATAHQWYAEFLAYQGRFDEALAESERARQLDPLSLIIATDNGTILYFARDYDRAIERFRAVLDMDPGFGPAHRVIGAHVQKKQFKEALADVEAWRRTAGDSPWIREWEANVYGQAGEPIKAQHALQELTRLNRTWHIDQAPLLARAYAGMNDREKSLSWLLKAYSAHSNALITLKVDPSFDPLRNDPRFQELLRRVGLAQ